MKKVILLLALGFFTFSATSLMAQTPIQTGQSGATTTTTTTTSTNTQKPTRGCGVKPNRAMQNKPAKGQAGKVKGHGKCVRKGQVSGRNTQALNTSNSSQQRSNRPSCSKKTSRPSKGTKTVKGVENRMKKDYQRSNSRS